jgi:hypothetical protein
MVVRYTYKEYDRQRMQWWQQGVLYIAVHLLGDKLGGSE